jgi:hypothetical protein
MSVRQTPPQQLLTAKQRLCLFHGTGVRAEEALGLDEDEITIQFFEENGVTSKNLATAGVGPRLLQKFGLCECSALRKLGFDALHLADSKFASEATAVFGAERVVETFLTGASDAVALAGSDAVEILGLTPCQLLEVCAGSPTEARAVLQQLPLGVSLEGVPAATVLDTGMRKPMLSELGYCLTSILKQTKASPTELQKLGYGSL